MKHLIWISILLAALIFGCKKDEKQTTATVTTTAPTNITANSATSGGDIVGNGGSAISKNGVCYAMHNNPTVADSVTSDGVVSSGSYSSSLNNLNANMTYYVRAYAINASGTGYGATDSFTTAKGVPTITTAAIANNQALMAQSGGNVTNDGGSPVTARGLCWSTSQHPTVASTKVSNGSGTGAFTDTLTNLTIATYYVRAYATNSFGTGYGNEISFTVSSTDVVTDIDGNSYGTVVIGTQTWTTSNLKVKHYLNGDSIINGLVDNFDWWSNILTSAYVGAYTFPNGDTTQKSTYGLLYNNYAVDDTRGLCPTGWHVPTNGEWQTLEYNQGMPASDTVNSVSQEGVGTSVGTRLLDGGSSGLNLQLAGCLIISSGSTAYNSFGVFGYYWSSTTYTGARIENLFRSFNQNNPDSGPIYKSMAFGFAQSVRCVKN